MAKGRKTGGRIKGVSKNKPKLTLPQTEATRTLALMVPDSPEVRTPKAVMLAAMLKFERMSDVLMAKAERMTARHSKTADIARVVAEAYKFTREAVQCADKVAPYIHARLLAVESRGDMTEDKAPYVLRAPMVLEDSAAWSAAVGAAIIEGEVLQSATGGQPEVLPHPARKQLPEPKPEPVPSPVPLTADAKTGRITTMPPRGSVVVRPAGAQDWLDAVAADKKKAAG